MKNNSILILTILSIVVGLSTGAAVIWPFGSQKTSAEIEEETTAMLKTKSEDVSAAVNDKVEKGKGWFNSKKEQAGGRLTKEKAQLADKKKEATKQLKVEQAKLNLTMQQEKAKLKKKQGKLNAQIKENLDKLEKEKNEPKGVWQTSKQRFANLFRSDE